VVPLFRWGAIETRVSGRSRLWLLICGRRFNAEWEASVRRHSQKSSLL